jgi:maltose-binding protein MalE
MKTKGILLKQIYFVLVIVVGLSFTAGCDITTKQQISSVISNINESPEVVAVRGSHMDDDVILGDLIDAGLSDTVWKIYDPAEDGNKYITISGNVLYKDTLIVVKIQYQMFDDEKIEFTAMSYNDVPQNKLNTAAMFSYLKSEYETKHISTSE